MNSRKIIRILAVFLILSLTLCLCACTSKTTYANNLEVACNTMIIGCGQAETLLNEILDVWNNSIYKVEDESTDAYTKPDDGNGNFYEDFNDALSTLYADKAFSEKITELQKNQSEVIPLMQSLKNPPKGYEEAYTSIVEFYDTYCGLTNLAITLNNGSYLSVSVDFKTLDNTCLQQYYKMQLYFG